MTARHTGAVFNHSCLKVPINPTNKLPLPTFERKPVPEYFENDHINKEISSQGTAQSVEIVCGGDRPSSSDSREGLSETLIPQDNADSELKIMGESTNKESLKSFIDFYESIPDYGDLNHLSDQEFYVRLQYLKAKQRTYLRDLDDKGVGMPEVDEDNEINTIKNLEKASAPSETWLKRYNDSLNLQGKKCDLDDKSPVPTSFGYQTDLKKYSYSGDGNLFRDKSESKKYISPSPTVSTVSVKDAHKIHVKSNPKPTVQLNNYVLETEESEGVSRIGLILSKSHHKGRKFKDSLPQRELYKIKAKKQSGTNKIRDTHFSSANEASTLIVNNARSIIDSLWDDFSTDRYVPKAELLSDSDSAQDDASDLAVSRSVPNSPVLKQNKNVAWQEPKITIPKPFNMTLREEEDRHVNLLWYQLYGADSLDEWKGDSKIIRAHPVPLASRLPLFDKIMTEQENRRRQVRRQCMNELRAQMKPFKFVKRDEERKLLPICHSSPDLRGFGDISPKPKPFKAKPVPKNLFSNYIYKRMREDEYYRSLKKKIRAEELLRSSSLPPSMAAREKLSKAKALSAEVLNTDSERQKGRKHKIPNYKKNHEQIQKQLEDRWHENITTSPQPFILKTAELHKRKSAKCASPDERSSISPYEVYPSPASGRRVRPQTALGIPLSRNNLASVLRIQSSRQRMEQELAIRQEDKRKKEEARFKAHFMRLKPPWQALTYSTEEDLAMRIQTRREEEKIRREEYEQDMKLMLSRVQNIPTLFERQSQKVLKEVHKNHGKSLKKSRHNMRISSIPTTPDLYEEDEREENYANQNNIINDRNTKMRLKVSINETPETVQCSTRTEDAAEIEIWEQDEVSINETPETIQCSTRTEDAAETEITEQYENEDHHEVVSEEVEKKDVEETKKNKNEEEREDESEETVSIQEDISAGGTTEDDEDGNTYTIDEK